MLRTGLKLTFCSLASLALLACGPKEVPVENTSIVPAAAAEASVVRDRNDNTQVLMEVKRLAPPEKLTPPATIYAVWAQTREGRTQLLGKLDVNEEGEGVFSGTVPIEPFRIIVSGESSLDGNAPSSQKVLITDYVETEG